MNGMLSQRVRTNKNNSAQQLMRVVYQIFAILLLCSANERSKRKLRKSALCARKSSNGFGHDVGRVVLYRSH